MSLDKAMKTLKLDKRMLDWMLRNGRLTKEELQQHLQSLPDLKDQVDLVNLSDDRSSRSEPH